MSSYELVMPFVTVRSRGGPHDDESYVAGYTMGLLDAKLSLRQSHVVETIRSTCRPQAELLAMRHGYVFTYDVTELNEWIVVSLRKIPG